GTFSICIMSAGAVEEGPCLNAPNDQWPAATFTPLCTGTVETITEIAWTGEYSMVQLTAGETYIFSSSVPTHWITISDETGTTALDYGNTPLTFTATTTGPHRFYTHLHALCDYANVSHTRAVQCGDIPDPPANDECANAIALTVGASGSCPENAVSG